MKLLARYEIQGIENVPETGAFVAAPNHYSNIDPVVTGKILYDIGRPPRYLAKASLWKIPVLGWFLTHTGQVPVERGGRSRSNDPLAAAKSIAQSGHAVVIYPEGSLTRDPELWPMRGKTGAVRTALEADVPLIPVAHWGVQEIMGNYSKRISLFPRKHVIVRFGKPVDLSAYRDEPTNAATLVAATATLMQAITAELETVRGEKAPVERWDPAKHNQSEIGRIEPR
jgi:1-acyl-sn-glycerol-3-phosphate acyltransferase